MDARVLGAHLGLAPIYFIFTSRMSFMPSCSPEERMWLVAEVDGGHAYCSLGVLHTNAVWLRTAWQCVGKVFVQGCMWFVDRSFRSFKRARIRHFGILA